MDHKTVITRIPPSPTGNLHLGTARTALFNYLFAKQHGGTFRFRSEDTDSKRSKREFEEEIIAGLQWLGIKWDGSIWRQSERTEQYTAALRRLLDSDLAFESIEPSKQDPTTYVTVVRLRNPNTTISFTDLIRGEITFDTTELGDFVIARAIDDPLYHLTVVVDDADMGVTHVLRGEDHISNTPRQILLLEALGFERPQYGHLPLILAADRSKMSKRNSVVAVQKYQEMGILPEALINYIALLGWNPGTEQEIFTLDELVAEFDIAKVQKGGAIFAMEKLKWVNKQHLERRTTAEQTTYVLDTFITQRPLTDQQILWLQRLVPTILERYHSKEEIVEATEAGEWDYVFTDPLVTAEQLQWKKDPDPHAALPRLEYLQELLTEADFSSLESIKAVVLPYAEEVGKGEVLWPFRVALSGQERSPDPFTLAYVLGRESTLRRLKSACAILQE